jgi:hypothetical protein
MERRGNKPAAALFIMVIPRWLFRRGFAAGCVLPVPSTGLLNHDQDIRTTNYMSMEARNE